MTTLVGGDGGPGLRRARAGDVRDSQADISKAQRILGYEPTCRSKKGSAGPSSGIARRRPGRPRSGRSILIPMERPGIGLSAVAVLLLALTMAGGAAPPADRVWFSPSPGSIDYIRLFERPEEWPHARQLVSVFKFYQQHTMTPAPSIVGRTPTTRSRAPVSSACQPLGQEDRDRSWAVKEFFCTPDASGMNAAIAATNDAVRAIKRAAARSRIWRWTSRSSPAARAPAADRPWNRRPIASRPTSTV
jgi:hypothetical protein